jgi:hypothetical protein
MITILTFVLFPKHTFLIALKYIQFYHYCYDSQSFEHLSGKNIATA